MAAINLRLHQIIFEDQAVRVAATVPVKLR
jgi:hypothetical protein